MLSLTLQLAKPWKILVESNLLFFGNQALTKQPLASPLLHIYKKVSSDQLAEQMTISTPSSLQAPFLKVSTLSITSLFLFVCCLSRNDMSVQQMLLCFSCSFLFWLTDFPKEGTISIPATPFLQLLLLCWFDQFSCQLIEQFAFAGFPALYFCFLWQIGRLNEQLASQATRHPLCFCAPSFWLTRRFDQQTKEENVSITSPSFLFCCYLSWNGKWMLLCLSGPFLFWLTNMPKEGTINIPATPLLADIKFAVAHWSKWI